MKCSRRSFMQVVVGLLGVAAVPFVASAQPGVTRRSGSRRIVFRHRTGPTACGHIAFRLKRVPAYGELLNASDALWPDGSPILPRTRIVCGHCKQPLSDFRMADIEVEGAA